VSLILGEQKIPALILAHLVARRSDSDYPTPAANALTLVAGPVKQTTVRTYPSLEVWVPLFTLGSRRDDERYDVMLDLHADNNASLDTELAQLASIRRAFAGGPISANSNATNSSTNPFLAYLESLDDNASAGWRIDDFYISGGSIVIDDHKRVIYRTEVKCAARSYVLTV
jgi:hypothetical protein